MPIPLIAAMAAAGLAKGMMDKGRENADRRQAAEMARWSPWSGMAPNAISKSDVMGSTMQGAMAGAMMDQAGWGGAGAAPAASGGGAGADLAAAGSMASLTGGQSQATPTTGYMGATDYNKAMAQKYPWLGMK